MTEAATLAPLASPLEASSYRSDENSFEGDWTDNTVCQRPVEEQPQAKLFFNYFQTSESPLVRYSDRLQVLTEQASEQGTPFPPESQKRMEELLTRLGRPSTGQLSLMRNGDLRVTWRVGNTDLVALRAKQSGGCNCVIISKTINPGTSIEKHLANYNDVLALLQECGMWHLVR